MRAFFANRIISNTAQTCPVRLCFRTRVNMARYVGEDRVSIPVWGNQRSLSSLMRVREVADCLKGKTQMRPTPQMAPRAFGTSCLQTDPLEANMVYSSAGAPATDYAFSASAEANDHAQTDEATIQASSSAAFPTERCFASVVKVFCDHTDPNFSLPWQMRRQSSSTGSGFAICGRRLMTNAHCVAYQNRILVRKHGDAHRYPAKLLAVAHECDLALLTVDDEKFWENLEPLEFAGLPKLHDSVVVMGYPTGGDNLSITAGVVSRLDVTTYAHSNFKLLCAQIDAAINPGNSGGPAFTLPDGRVAGVAFQGYGDAQNIGYIVPSSVIQHFLNDVERHKGYTGFVVLGVIYQPLESDALQRFFGLKDLDTTQLPPGITASGILIGQVDTVRNEEFQAAREKRLQALPPAERPSETPIPCGLQKNDILIALNNVDVANDGTIHFRGMERVHLSHTTLGFFSGDSVEALVLRNKQLLKVEVPLYKPNFLVPEHQWDQPPRYFIFGGLVFCPLTVDYLKDEFGKKYYERAPTWLMSCLSEFFPKKPQQEVVILSQILASDLTIGYDMKNCRLHKVDGVPVENMAHLITLLAQPTDDRFVRFEFDHEIVVVLDRHATFEKTPSLLKEHAIGRPWSEDLNDLALPFFQRFSPIVS